MAPAGGQGGKPTVAIVQARMGSSRLPGKVLLELAGRPVLVHVHERLARVGRIDRIVFATTSEPGDRPIVELCARHGFDVYAHEGPVDDLLGRYIGCARRYDADIVVMVDGDCPLLHPPTVDRMVAALEAHPEAEYCRLDPRSIEGGVAVLRRATYERMAELATEDAHREHATLFLMENPDRFSIVEVPCEDALRDVEHRLWLDTPADYRFLSAVYDRLSRPGAIPDLREVVGLIRTEPALAALNAHVTQKDVRAAAPSLCVRAPGLDPAAGEGARRIVARLVERFNAGVQVVPEGMDEAQAEGWRAAGFALGDCEGPTLLFDASADVVAPRAPSAAGDARLAARPSGDPDETAALVAAHVGLRGTEAGRFAATLRTSDDGSHLSEAPCALCGGAASETLWEHRDGVRSGICTSCGHVHLTRTLPPEVIAASYRAFAQSVPEAALCATDGDVARLAAARVGRVRALPGAPPASVLEIGSGYGHFLAGLGDVPLRAGIEPSRVQARFARKHFRLAETWECEFGALAVRPPTWPQEGFDLIASFHVLEHVRDPRAMLAFARRTIAPQGALCLAVPNLATLSPDLIELHFLAKCWHLHTFTRDALARLLASEGFEVVSAVEEEPIAMLRSSLFVQARPVSSAREAGRAGEDAGAEEIAAARTLAVAFHRSLDARLARARAAFARWRDEGARVVVYGGGIHTAALLDLAGVDPAAIACIADDDPAKHGGRLAGVPIVGLEDALARGVDVVVASSLAAEDAMLARLGTILPGSATAVGVYRDLMESSEGSQT